MRALKSIHSIANEVSKWQQLRLIDECADLGDAAKSEVLGWLDSKNDSLVELGLRMCLRMGWYEVKFAGLALLKHKREEIRKLSTRAIGQLGAPELLPELIRRFEVESKTVQVEIIKAIAELDVEQSMTPFLKAQVWVHVSLNGSRHEGLIPFPEEFSSVSHIPIVIEQPSKMGYTREVAGCPAHGIICKIAGEVDRFPISVY